MLSFNLLVNSLPVQQENTASRLTRNVVEEQEQGKANRPHFVRIIITDFVIIGEEGDLFEGDIKLTHEDRKRRMVMQDLPLAQQPALDPSLYSGTLWPNGTIYFKFHENISKLSL